MKKVIEISEAQEKVIIEVLEQINSSLEFEAPTSFVLAKAPRITLSAHQRWCLASGIDAIHDTSTNWEDLHN